MAKLAWVLMMGFGALISFFLASTETLQRIQSQPVLMTLQEDANVEFLSKRLEQEPSYAISTPVILKFEDGETLHSQDSRLERSEVKQLLNGDSINVYYHDGHEHAIYDETELPNPIVWWVLTIFLTLVFLFGLKLWRQDYAN